MREFICYMGDDDLGGAAIYLAGIMAHFGLPYQHVPSPQSPDAALAEPPCALYVLSDYPAARFRPGQLQQLVEYVRAGSGLAMFGGWESFHGRLGEYQDSPLAEVLPVQMLHSDDRRNCAQPCVVRATADHAILADLPWDSPPCIGGYNAIVPKPEAQTLLSARPFSIARRGDDFHFAPQADVPLLMVGSFGQGRTAALATDVAPHWVGGLVDWGRQRITQSVGSGLIEVGEHYARLFHNLLMWTGRLTQD
jgi:uncharacterized membrane protein